MQIHILDHVVFKDGITIPVIVRILPHGCIVEYIPQETPVMWDEANDVEKLSDLFAEYPVCAFKVIVQMLGKVYANKDAYMMALQA